MGIYDRDWYRSGTRLRVRRASSPLRVLLIVNVVCFLLTSSSGGRGGWIQSLALVPEEVVLELRVWQLVTSMFLHANLMHLLFNMFFLWMFGQYVERRLGPRPFLRFYFGAGVLASLAYVVMGMFTGPKIPAIGASGAVMGVVIYYAMLRPNDTVLLFFIIPLKMKWAALLFVGIDLIGFLKLQTTGIAHTAHLGGALFGFLYYRYAHRISRYLLNREIGRRSRAAMREEGDLGRLQAEVDLILGKISVSGMASLSEKEKRFLVEASERLRGLRDRGR